MPVPDLIITELGLLRADDRRQLSSEHLLHHHQPRRGREREQPGPSRIASATSAIATVAFHRQTNQIGCSLRCRDPHDRYLLHR